MLGELDREPVERALVESGDEPLDDGPRAQLERLDLGEGLGREQGGGVGHRAGGEVEG